MKSEETGNVQNMGNGTSTNYTVMTQPERFDSLFGSVAMSPMASSASGTSSTSGSSASGSSGGSSTGSSTGTSTGSSTGSSTGGSSAGSSGGSSAGGSTGTSTGSSGGSSGVGGGGLPDCSYSGDLCATVTNVGACGSCSVSSFTLTYDGPGVWNAPSANDTICSPPGSVNESDCVNTMGCSWDSGTNTCGCGQGYGLHCTGSGTWDLGGATSFENSAGCNNDGGDATGGTTSPFELDFTTFGSCTLCGGFSTNEPITIVVTAGDCGSSGGSSTTSSTSSGTTGTSSTSSSGSSSGTGCGNQCCFNASSGFDPFSGCSCDSGICGTYGGTCGCNMDGVLSCDGWTDPSTGLGDNCNYPFCSNCASSSSGSSTSSGGSGSGGSCPSCPNTGASCATYLDCCDGERCDIDGTCHSCGSIPYEDGCSCGTISGGVDANCADSYCEDSPGTCVGTCAPLNCKTTGQACTTAADCNAGNTCSGGTCTACTGPPYADGCTCSAAQSGGSCQTSSFCQFSGGCTGICTPSGISTACCPGVQMPATLTATFSDGPSCLNGISFPITYAGGEWSSGPVPPGLPNGWCTAPGGNAVGLMCNSGTWQMSDATGGANCLESPFTLLSAACGTGGVYMTFSVPLANDAFNPCGGGTATITVSR